MNAENIAMPKTVSITISDNTESFTATVPVEIWESRDHMWDFLDEWAETYVHYTHIPDENTAEVEFEIWATRKPDGRTEKFVLEVAAELF